MKIAVFAAHCGSSGLSPYGFGGGEAYTYGFLAVLSAFYDVTAIVPNGVYPGFDSSAEYGIDVSHVKWKPIGDDMGWVREFDCLININHGYMLPPICRRNILVTFFPQNPDWDTTGYDTIVTISKFSQGWIKKYWGRDSIIVPPPMPVEAIISEYSKIPGQIVSVGRFFEVPGGNNKNHAVVIEAFRQLKARVNKPLQLHLVGTILSDTYYKRIADQAAQVGDVHFHHDLDRAKYMELLGESQLVIAATGYGTDNPSSAEHFGMFAVEAMAVNTPVLAYNSGGTPEIGVQTWDSAPELVDLAAKLLTDEIAWRDVSLAGLASIRRFDIERVASGIINVIEMPVVSVGGPRGKIFFPDLDAASVAMWADSPGITTGFGLSTKMIARGLVEAGYDVSVLGLQDPMYGKPRISTSVIKRVMGEMAVDGMVNVSDVMRALAEIEPCDVWRGSAHDAGGWLNAEHFFKTVPHDVVFLSYDIGNVRNMLNKLRDIGGNAPIVSLFPVEGQPIIPQYIETIRLLKCMNGFPLAYTKWGAEAIRKFGGPLIDYAYLGVDHAKFAPIPTGLRENLRKAIGWDDKFVCITVGRNKRTKGLPTVIYTAKALKEMGYGDKFLFYLHTSVSDGIVNSSMPIREIAKLAGVSEMIVIPDLNQLDGVPYDEPAILGNVPDTDDLSVVRAINLSTMSMTERFRCADVYLNLSELEGFGLPQVEAQACGLPIVSVDDNGVQREVLGSAPIYVPVSHWDTTWHTGAVLAQVNPNDAARALVDLAFGPQSQLDEMSAASFENSKRFRWGDAVSKIRQAIREVI